MAVDLPANLQFGTIADLFPIITGDGVDTGSDPDATPPTGAKATFTASMPLGILRDAGSTPPATLKIMPVVCGYNSAGELVDPQGAVNVRLVATNQGDDFSPDDWEWTVSFTGYERTSFAFQLDPGTDPVYLTTVEPVSITGGVQIIRGPDGDDGIGVVNGGDADDVLTKLSGADGDYAFAPPTAGTVPDEQIRDVVGNAMVSGTGVTVTVSDPGDTYTFSTNAYLPAGTDVAVTDGGSGRSTGGTAYGLIAAGTSATAVQQTIGPGSSGQFLKSAGAAALPSFAGIAAGDVSGLAAVATSGSASDLSTGTVANARLDADLAGIANQSFISGDVPYMGAVATWTKATSTTAGRSMLTAADAAAQRSLLNLTDELARNGLLAATYRVSEMQAGTQTTAGVVYAGKLILPQAQTITNICLYVTAAGSTLTSGQNLAGLYTISGGTATLVATSVTQHTAWASSGAVSCALTGTYAAAAGDFIAVLLTNGTTQPTFARITGSGNPFQNAFLSTANSRVFSSGTSQTALPATITLSGVTQSAPNYWFGLS